MTAINTDRAPAAIGPYVQGVTLGDLVITSGQLPLDPQTKTMPADPAEQATQSLHNALAILEQAGLNATHIKKTTVFIKDMSEFAVINAAYQAFFEQHDAPFPARSCVEVARLPLGARIEIEVIAAK